MAVGTSENTDCGIHEWNKILSYTEKLKYSLFTLGQTQVFIMLLFATIMFLPTRPLSCQKANFYS